MLNHIRMMPDTSFGLKLGFLWLTAATMGYPGVTNAQDTDGRAIEEIVVTSRYREELLQNVPDTITVFDSTTIEKAGLDELVDVVNLTPNVLIRETFRAGVSFITIRGITTAQQGWPPISYVLDGVQTNTLDAINQGVLLDIERIEILKGPQGALYGAGAIAGAFNVTTKEPTDAFSGKLDFQYAEGNDLSGNLLVSGPISESVKGRVAMYYRNTDGLIDDVDGLDLDFEEQFTIRGRLMIEAMDSLSFDLTGSYTDVEAGAVYQSLIPSFDDLNTFGTSTTTPNRGGFIDPGTEDRTIENLTAKMTYESDIGSFVTTASYMNIEQTLFGSASFREPPVQGIFGIYLEGENALPGEAIDDFQDARDDFENINFDMRLISRDDLPIRWMFGASAFSRDAENRLTLGEFVRDSDSIIFVDRTDLREDDWWGVYGQVNYDVSERMELSVAARYDEATYSTTQFADDAMTIVVPVLDPGGNLVTTLEETASDLQPKIQLSYKPSEQIMIYASYAEGFRPGFFNSGNLTRDESTRNFEVGIKTELAGGATVLNGAVFLTDYSDQQISFITNTPPFRLTENIESSDIQGLEIDLQSRLGEFWTFYSAIGFTDAETGGGNSLPAIPEWTVNVGMSLDVPISGDLDFTGRVDYRYQDEFFLGSASNLISVPVDAQNFVNLRVGVSAERWSVVVYGKNLLDEHYATDAANFGIGILRPENKPRSIGIRTTFAF